MDNSMQLIIGVDKNNPHFSIYRNSKTKEIYVYLGFALMEIIPDVKDNPQLKILLARLFNASVNKSALTREFGYCYHTLERWGNALKSGSPEELVRALSGQGAPKKLTKEIEAYVSHRFKSIYAKNKRSYSQEVRNEIKHVFQVEISSETLRCLFNKLKADFKQNNSKQEKKK